MTNPDPQLTLLAEGVDFYVENGRWVFTEHFLRRRGYCCKSGCRHCPYDNEDAIEPIMNPPESTDTLGERPK